MLVQTSREELVLLSQGSGGFIPVQANQEGLYCRGLTGRGSCVCVNLTGGQALDIVIHYNVTAKVSLPSWQSLYSSNFRSVSSA